MLGDVELIGSVLVHARPWAIVASIREDTRGGALAELLLQNERLQIAFRIVMIQVAWATHPDNFSRL